jgi:hypothetical protein
MVIAKTLGKVRPDEARPACNQNPLIRSHRPTEDLARAKNNSYPKNYRAGPCK